MVYIVNIEMKSFSSLLEHSTLCYRCIMIICKDLYKLESLV